MSAPINARNFDLDALRGLSIIAVVILHCAGYVNSSHGIVNDFTTCIITACCRFCVPIFFMCSGSIFLVRDIAIPSFLNSRVRRLLIPTLFWVIFYALWDKALFNSPLAIKEFIKAFISENVKYHLWFLFAIGGCYLFFPFLQRFRCNSSQEEVNDGCLLLFSLGTVPTVLWGFMQSINWRTPSNYVLLSDAAMFLGYFLYPFVRIPVFLKANLKLLIFAFITITLLLATGKYYTQFISQNRAAALFDCFSSPFVSLQAIVAFHLIPKLVALMPQFFKSTLTHLSLASFSIYLIHVAILDALSFWPFFQLFPGVIKFSLALLIALSSSYGVSCLLRRMKITRLIIGE